jgi:uncharacterized protein YggE
VDEEIRVRGTAEVRVAPDRAVLHVTVDAEAAGRDDAYRTAAQTAAAVDAVLAAHESEIARTVTAALIVQPRTRWHKGETKRTGWLAARRSVVELAVFDRLGDLYAELTTAGATIVGPSWVVDEDNPAHREARRIAAADARTRAEDFASGLGVGIAGVAWISEPGLRPVPPGGGADLAYAPQARSLAFAGAAPEETIDVQPEDVIITAVVEVGFRLVDESPT